MSLREKLLLLAIVVILLGPVVVAGVVAVVHGDITENMLIAMVVSELCGVAIVFVLAMLLDDCRQETLDG